MKGIKDHISQPLENSMFQFAAYDSAAAEKAGYSNYSYWGSTFRCFLKNKAAMVFMTVLVLLLLFTMIQPYLPNQYPANLVIDHPITGMQMMNVKPRVTNVEATAEKDTLLIVTPWENEEWLAVSNVLSSIPRRENFTVLEYGSDFCKVEYKGKTGYVKNDFTTKLKLPDDYENTPYEAKSNYKIEIFTTPNVLTYNGDELFVKKSSVKMLEDGNAITIEKSELRLLPDTRPFLFGTNNAGQDLWAMVWSGTRTSLLIGIVVAFCQAMIGILIGVLWGYVRSLDRLLTEVYNIIDNIPTTIVLILVSYIMRPGVSTLIFAMSLTGWVGMARFVRNQIVIIRDRDYNLASRCLGTGTFRIITRNLLPYLVSVITLRMALSVPGAIGSEVFITYIGLGLPISIPSLGNLINVGRMLLATSASYQLVFPTIVLSIITISFYIIGNSFADAADPKNHL
ncbi:MAG: ABC transporter permease [Clostridiales bacterium]|nr:ABC transporter permease [Clostridiales bacterium]